MISRTTLPSSSLWAWLGVLLLCVALILAGCADDEGEPAADVAEREQVEVVVEPEEASPGDDEPAVVVEPDEEVVEAEPVPEEVEVEVEEEVEAESEAAEEAAEEAVAEEAVEEELPTTGVAFGKRIFVDTWTPGDKLGVGTAYTYDEVEGGEPAPSRVWFTITDGAITDILYPTIGRASIKELSLLVAGPDGVEREIDVLGNKVKEVEYLDPRALAYRVTSGDEAAGWEAVKEVVTDPTTNSLITRWTFTADNEAVRPYAYFVPHLGGSGRRDLIAVEEGVVLAWDEQAETYAALIADPAPLKASVGYLQSSSGLEDLADGEMDWTFDRIPDPSYGAGTLALPSGEPVTMVVGFGATEEEALEAARHTLARGFEAVAADYIQSWHDYLDELIAPESPPPLYWISAMVLKAHEDKTYHGAGVASLSIPWGQCLIDERPTELGYRYVWPRDLYHVAMAFIALGDVESAQITLAYLDELQRDNGSWPQNAFIEMRTRWQSLQMDEVADPILLAWNLGAIDRYESLVKPAADFIAEKGPTTLQERWEEIGGYSPHAIAAQIAGLVTAADMAAEVGDVESAERWLAVADEWNANLEAWTFTTDGLYGDGEYFLRVTPDGDPNEDEMLTIANGGGMHPMKFVIDVSALELPRLGVRAPTAPSVVDTLPEIDEALREETPNGPGWHRYAYDAYGEPEFGECAPGAGHLWPLFNGERGIYALAAGDAEYAAEMLATMERFANQGGMIPEQVFAETGEGTGSATPLAWAHAEYILLARALDAGFIPDTPSIVAERYARETVVSGK